MKKYFYTMLAAGMLLATSCSQDNELVDIIGGESRMVTLKVKVPNQTESRTVGDAEIGDGSKADHLIWAMYEENSTDTLITGKTVETSDGIFSISVPMAKDLRYDLLFLAYNEENCPFVLDETAPNKTNLRNLEFKNIQKANNEAMDAFVGVHNVGIDNQAVTELKLYRPFAQINAATSLKDMQDAKTLKAVVTKSMMTIMGAPKYYNVYSQETKDTVNVTYTAGDVLICDDATEYPNNETITVDDTDYYYLSLAYVLAGANKDSKESTHEADFEFYRENGDKVSSLNIRFLPIQRNFRTNVVGNLLTKVEDYQIKIDAEFGGSHVYTVWDGKTYKEPQKDANGAYIVSSAPEYAWLSRYSNTGSRAVASVEGTIEIVADIDLGGYTISAIAVNNNSLTVNGNGHCIKNASVVSGGNDNGTEQASLFFGSTGTTLTINDLNVDNLVVKAKKEAYEFGGYAAAIVAYSQTTLTLNNVHVTNSTMYATQTLGALVGMVEGSNKAVIKNCSADGIILNNYKVEGESGNTGGLIGKVAGGATLEMENTAIKNTVINASILKGEQARTVSKYIGNYVGGANGVITIKDGSIDNVTLNIAEGSVENQSCLYGDFLGGWRNAGGTVTINGAEITKETNIVDNAEEFATAIANAQDGAVIPVMGAIVTTELKADAGNNVTIVGMSDDATIDFTSTNSFVNTTGNITFKNLAIKLDETRVYYSNGINNQGYTNIYENVDFYGVAVNYGTSVYKNCTFTNTKEGGNSYPAWIYSGNAIYEGCTFVGVDRTAKVYCEAGNTCEVTFSDCTFKATKVGGDKPNKTGVEVACKNPNVKHFVTINNAIVDNTAEAEHYGTKVFNIESDNKGNGVVTIDGETYAQLVNGDVLQSVLNMQSKSIIANLNANVTIAGGTTPYGGAETENITINGNDNELTFEDSYRTYIKTNGAKMILNDVEIVRSTSNSSNHWHNCNIHFSNELEMNNVTFNKGIAISNVGHKAVLNQVKINRPEENCSYAMFITVGSNVEMNDCEVTAIAGDGRCIKVTNEDHDAETASTVLKVTKTKFSSDKKAAILVESHTETNIALSEVNIENVKADKVNAVWNDADCPQFFDLINVTGGTKVQEE